MPCLRGEPPVEFGTAAVACGRRGLILALGFARRAVETHMEMIVMSPPWANSPQPAAIGAGLAAERSLGRRVDKNARHRGGTCRGFKQLSMLRPPHGRVD